MKKLTILLTCVVMLFSLLSAAHAAELSEYQAVIDKINAEYGTNVRFATPEELAHIGPLPVDFRTQTLEEFEQSIIRAIQTPDTNAGWQPSVQGERYESPYGDSTIDGQKSYYDTKPLSDCTIHLYGGVSDNNGYWQFTDITNSYARPIFDANGIGFDGAMFSYSFLDTRRTCAVTIQGFRVTTGGMVVGIGSRYAEFTAK